MTEEYVQIAQHFFSQPFPSHLDRDSHLCLKEEEILVISVTQWPTIGKLASGLLHRRVDRLA